MNSKHEKWARKEELWPLLVEAVSVYNVLPLTSTCNLNCIFCSHLQNPPGIRAYYFPPLPLEELKHLIPFLDGSRKIIIGESSTRLSEGEPLTHPQFLSVIREIRKYYPDTLLQITTNGALLNRALLQKLQSLSKGHIEGQDRLPDHKPKLELVISLNSSSSHWRSKVMGDKSPWKALETVRLCRELAVPFHGSVVALPHIYGWDSLKETLFFLEEMDALTTRLFLPGYTRFSPPWADFGKSLLGDLSEFLQELSDDLKHPVVLEPPLKKDLLARVEGVIRFSPAENAGLKKGDIINTVNRKKVISGVEAFFLIQKALNPLLEVSCSGEVAENSMEKSTSIKLSKKRGESSGVVFSYDLEADAVFRVNARANSGRRPFLLTSVAAAPLWEAAKRESLLPRELSISSVANFFFGGSICCAGLLTVSDFKKHLLELLKLKEIPDLVIIPLKPFDEKGFDLKGDHFRELPAAFPQLTISFL